MTKRMLVRVLNLLGAAVAVVAAVPVAARLLEPRYGTPIPQLAAFGPWVLPLWVLAGVLLLLGRRRRGAGVVLVIIAVVLGVGIRWQVPPGAARASVRTSADGGTAVRVMTQNVLYGRADAAQLLALVRQYRVDVLVVEELSPDFLARFRAGIDEPLGHADLHPHPRAAGTGIWPRRAPRFGGSGGTGGTFAVTGIHTGRRCRAPVRSPAGVTTWR